MEVPLIRSSSLFLGSQKNYLFESAKCFVVPFEINRRCWVEKAFIQKSQH